ncbi:MAG TPA: lipid-A-disaccharide synthase [Xanthobacteraceae bacterium]|nr:lipid-A-disaccharide synthase [Xanthobacteraceae bacterium]
MTAETQSSVQPLSIFVVAAEESGDALGAALARALVTAEDGVRLSGVGGTAMAANGIVSPFSIGELSIIGVTAIPRRLPTILRRIRETAGLIIKARPHALVIIDSPDFTHRVARRVRRFAPQIPILDYVSPSVWAWRAGRARAMRSYVDHVLAILPFEPAAHRRLGGPPCTYVGHPLVERIADLRPGPYEARRRLADPPLILALPGSRSGEIRRLASIFGAALERVAARIGPIEVVVPTVANVAPQLREAVADWAIRPRVVVEAAEKWTAFRNARAALAASGTVTLELALSGVPMVAAYRLDFIEAVIARAIRLQARLPSVILANLVIGENVVPELLQEECTPDKLADALLPVVRDTEQRRRQVEAFRRLDEIMMIGGPPPSAKAAAIVLKAARMGRNGLSALIEAPSPG